MNRSAPSALPTVSVSAQARYLDALARGSSHTSAILQSGATRHQINRLLALDPDFQTEARAAEQAAADQVEETVFRLATGQKTPARQEYEMRRTAEALEANPDQPPPDFQPNDPSLAAAKLYLENRAPHRWAARSDAPTTTVNISALLTPEGVSDFQTQLQARRDALTTTATPEAPGRQNRN